MPARSVVVQLQAGVGQAVLPDHRKMVPGKTYVIDWDTFQKISNSARQNVIQVVTINNDSTTTGSFVPAQTDSGYNSQLNLQAVLTTVSTTPINWDAGGFAAQGFDADTNTGVQPNIVGAGGGNTLQGPAGERYMYIYNPSTNISGGQVLTWFDENNRYATNTRPSYVIIQDGQGTAFQQSVIDSTTSPSTVGTKQGRFAGVALVNVPSGNYGWIQSEGICPAVSISGNIAAGATLAVATASGWAKSQAATATVVSGGIVTGSALANNVFGTAVTSGTTNDKIVVDIRSFKAKKPYVRFLNKN